MGKRYCVLCNLHRFAGHAVTDADAKPRERTGWAEQNSGIRTSLAETSISVTQTEALSLHKIALLLNDKSAVLTAPITDSSRKMSNIYSCSYRARIC